MKLNSFTLAAVIFVLLFGGIGFTSAMNWWQTESTKEPVKYSEGEAAGEYNPADIRGSYTFGEISDLFGVPLADLQVAFRVPADTDPAAYLVKSLEEQFAGLPVEVGTASMRLFVAFYKGLPYDLTAEIETYLLPEAVTILEQQGKLTPEQGTFLSSHVAGEEALPAPEATAAPETTTNSADTEHEPEAYTVTGQTTFKDLLDWGVPQEAIESILGEKMPAQQILVKDYATSKGETFSALKGKLQGEVDKHK
jgi:hypothetical protein